MENPKIIIDDRELSYDDLSVESKILYQHVVDITNQVDVAKFKLTQLEATKQLFESEFVKSTSTEKEE